MKSRISKEFIVYCLVGLVNTLVGLSTAFTCLNWLLLSYSVSTGLAYITGSVVSFYLNKKFTFHNTGKAGMQFVKFFMTMLPAYLISYWLGFQICKISSEQEYFAKILDLLSAITAIPSDRLTANSAVLLSMAIYLAVGFSINKFLIFKKHTNQENLSNNID